MIVHNVHETKTNLSRLLDRVEAGEEIIIGRSGRPIAKLVPLLAGRRQLGGDEGRVILSPDFDAPLPESVLKDFEGG